MKPMEIKRAIEEKLTNANWITSYDRKNENLRIIDKRVNKGLTVQLSALQNKFKENKVKALEDTMHYIYEGLNLLQTPIQLTGNEKHLYPVMRSTSFPVEAEDGRKFIFTEHTAETRIFYALDHGPSYSLIDEESLKRAGKTMSEIQETAQFNLRSLSNELKEDTVAGNRFYFLHTDDGYDAGKILNDALLREMQSKVEGELAVAIPHQDVLIFADIRNETGYDVLAQMVFQFFNEGRVPITALPFVYENGELEPIFILAQRKPKGTKKDSK
ncbi:Uncharacterized protein YtpQ, UPF0354 family [Evansella caseinilytica]|uniref:Uncharacterized protein YtpQ, UPF0354 family n=1 Tax=Evansella caseinilytica TaxID=1503961 RepID=A0A1H3RUP6_9BACI|nr:DUF1444 domain-containing protein [Evansella caseinilytica]SDZ29038.1 Uncharacterized protein YtpQ, UPF0354 family [Evansella caseinilytica]